MQIFAKRRAYFLGMIAEWIVMGFYLLQGYRLLYWRYRCPAGEIDLVFSRRQIVVCVEVKARRNPHSRLEEAISHKQRMRISRAAQYFAAMHPRFRHHCYRMDAIMICFGGKSKWIKGAW